MEFLSNTKIRCSRPELVNSGSEFYRKWDGLIHSERDGMVVILSENYHLIEDLKRLSSENPEVTFTGITWSSVGLLENGTWIVVFQAGVEIDVKLEPFYHIPKLAKQTDDKDFLELLPQFKQDLRLSFERFDLPDQDIENENYMEFLTVEKDQEGSYSYYLVHWKIDQCNTKI